MQSPQPSGTSLLKLQSQVAHVERQELQLSARIKLLELEEARLLHKIDLTRKQA
jgi:hypothetical protein